MRTRLRAAYERWFWRQVVRSAVAALRVVEVSDRHVDESVIPFETGEEVEPAVEHLLIAVDAYEAPEAWDRAEA